MALAVEDRMAEWAQQPGAHSCTCAPGLESAQVGAGALSFGPTKPGPTLPLDLGLSFRLCCTMEILTPFLPSPRESDEKT